MSRAPDEQAEARILARAFARVDEVALGLAAGVVLGFTLLAATAWLVLKGGAFVGRTLSLLSHYFPGYNVTWGGALVGLLYGAAIGFLIGWTLAHLRNLAIGLFLRYVRYRSEREAQKQFLDYV